MQKTLDAFEPYMRELNETMTKVPAEVVKLLDMEHNDCVEKLDSLYRAIVPAKRRLCGRCSISSRPRSWIPRS